MAGIDLDIPRVQISRVFCALALFAIAMTTGCSTTAQLASPRGPELDLPPIQKMAVLDFDGPHDSGKIARSALTSQFSSTDHYRLVDQSELDRYAKVTQPQGAPDVQAALAAGRQMGIDAILTGTVVSYDVYDDVTESEFVAVSSEETESDDGLNNAFAFDFERNILLNREGSVSLAFKLLDVETGEVIASRQTQHTFNGQIKNGEGALPVRDQILTQLLDECSRDVLEMISPHDKTVDVKLASVWPWEDGASDIRKGNKLASEGNWKGAANRYDAVLKEHPQNHAALHNLAVAHEAQGDFVSAELHLNDALGIDKKTQYRDTAARLETAKAGQFHRIARRFPQRNARRNASRERKPSSTIPVGYQRPGFDAQSANGKPSKPIAKTDLLKLAAEKHGERTPEQALAKETLVKEAQTKTNLPRFNEQVLAQTAEPPTTTLPATSQMMPKDESLPAGNSLSQPATTAQQSIPPSYPKTNPENYYQAQTGEAEPSKEESSQTQYVQPVSFNRPDPVRYGDPALPFPTAKNEKQTVEPAVSANQPAKLPAGEEPTQPANSESTTTEFEISG